MKLIAPDKYGLSSRTILREMDVNHIGIVKKIKSRIISKNAQKIVAIVQHINFVDPNQKVSLVCTKNICTKSIALLAEHQIEIFFEEID